MGDEERDGSGRTFSWNRRRVLAATTMGIAGLAGCGGSGDSGDDGGDEEDDEDETTEVNGSSPPDDADDMGGSSTDDESGGGTSGSDDIPVDECPMITGSYNTFESERGPLPFSFEYPAIIDETENPMAYANRESQTIVNGQYFRDDLPGEGDIYMDANVNLNPVRNRDTWYENRSDRATFLTTPINGAEVTFVGTTPDMSFGEDRVGYSAVGLAPYTWDSARESPTGTTESYHEISIGILLSLGDDKTIAPSCAGNLRTVLENGVESIEMLSGVEMFEERV